MMPKTRGNQCRKKRDTKIENVHYITASSQTRGSQTLELNHWHDGLNHTVDLLARQTQHRMHE